uniref:Uncharacterized protein n=1 Tax=Anguilla anguilla TaxID=7936 RepID=A0A0E9Q4K4_ANGAN
MHYHLLVYSTYTLHNNIAHFRTNTHRKVVTKNYGAGIVIADYY